MKGIKWLVGVLLVLLTIGTLTATIAMASTTSKIGNKVEINEIKENYAFIVRDFSKGISINEIKKIRQNFVNKVKSKCPEKVVAFAVPDIPEGAKIVAYGIKIDNNVIKQYFGFAGDRESAEIIYKKAQKWYNRNILESSEKSVSIKASAG